MLTDEEINQIIDTQINSNPTVIFDYMEDIQSFDRLIQILFNKSKLGPLIQTIQNGGYALSTEQWQTLYDIAYKYIPRKMDDKVSEERVRQTTEKTIKRLIKSASFGFYNNLKDVKDIIKDRINEYPIENYSVETLKNMLDISEYDVNVFFKIFPYIKDSDIIEVIIKNVLNNCPKDNNLANLIDFIMGLDSADIYKEDIDKLIAQYFISSPRLLKNYNGEFDRYTLIFIIGKALKQGIFDEIKEILLSKNISEEMINSIDSLYKMNYNYDELDNDITFDDVEENE